MTALATVIAFPAKRPEGRPSNAALQLEAVTLRNALATEAGALHDTPRG